MDERLWPRPYQANCPLKGKKKFSTKFQKNPKFQNAQDIIQNYSTYMSQENLNNLQEKRLSVYANSKMTDTLKWSNF